jgi:hypothetical protein
LSSSHRDYALSLSLNLVKLFDRAPELALLTSPEDDHTEREDNQERQNGHYHFHEHVFPPNCNDQRADQRAECQNQRPAEPQVHAAIEPNVAFKLSPARVQACPQACVFW